MPTVSVKLAEATKLRLNRLAASQGVSPHAIMVDAIETALSNAENHNEFVAQALRSREQVIASGQVQGGPAFTDYLKARARGRKVARPRAVRIASLVPRT